MLFTSRDLAGKFNPINGPVTDNFLFEFTRELFNGFSGIFERVWDNRLRDREILRRT